MVEMKVLISLEGDEKVAVVKESARMVNGSQSV